MLQHVALAGIDLCSMKRRVRKKTHTHTSSFATTSVAPKALHGEVEFGFDQ